jgi:hypothetical protein
MHSHEDKLDRLHHEAMGGHPHHMSQPLVRSSKFIQEVVSSPSFKKGAFTKQAKAHGMTTKQMMNHVLAHPEDYDMTTRRRAQFMKNALSRKA